MPATLRGSPWAPPDEDKGYAGGRLSSTKVLGAYVGDSSVCATQLCARVAEALAPLEHAVRVRDTRAINVSLQVQHEILRYCANTSLVYFLRTMGVEATRRAAELHDTTIERALHKIIGTGAASAGQAARAAEQARLPVRMGGCGYTPQTRIADAACVGSWALIWRPMQQLCPQLFKGVDLERAPQPVFQELREARARLMEKYQRVSGVYARWDSEYFDYDKDGNGHCRFHPDGLPKEADLLPLSKFGTDDDLLQGAQRRYSSVEHHSSWLKLQARCQAVGRREAVRFVSVSQPHAGSFLNAVPKHKPYRMPTWAMRLELQRRLGLPLLVAAAAGDRRTRHGQRFDALGDAAANDGEAGHQTRHFLTLRAVYDALRRVYGGCARYEPQDYIGYSDHRPDITLLVEGSLTAFDLKVFDPIGSQPATTEERGAYVAFGNTAEVADGRVLGRRGRGVAGDGTFCRRTCAGHVAPVVGDYARALANGVTCVPLLVETFGGFGRGLVQALKAAAEWRGGKLTSSEFDETTWAARKYLPFVCQKISVAMHLSTAQEIAEALGLATAADPRL